MVVDIMSYNPIFATRTTAETTAITNNVLNFTGSTLNKATPVRIALDGTMNAVDVAIESDVLTLVGVLSNTTLHGYKGKVISSGKIEDITTSANIGETIYLSKTGTLTNQVPTIGVDGFVADDFVVRLGVLAANDTNPILKDLIVNISVVGTL